MESKPRVETRPPVAIETVARLLIPPAAREHVLGDLSERYSSLAQYVIDAMRTIPFVVTSQIRRTSYFPIWPLVSFLLMAGFSAGTPWWGVHSLIPSLAVLIGYMFRDAYRVPDVLHPWRQGLVDLFIVGGTVVAVEGLVALTRPESLIRPAGIAGGAVILVALFVLRGKNPGRRPDLEPVYGSAMTLDQLRDEVALYDRTTRRAITIELAIGYAMLPAFAAFSILDPDLLARVGAGLTVSGIAFVVWYMHRSLRNARWTSTNGDFTTLMTGYRARLEHHVHALRTVWLWYLLPLGIGPALMVSAGITRADQAPRVAVIGALGGVMLIWIWTAWFAGHQRRSIERRLAALTHVNERR
jgi:hypothetical protein